MASCAPRIESLLTDAVYSARLSSHARYLNKNGRDQWLAWRRETIRLIGEGYVWLVRTDLTSYFDSIEHRLLFADIDRSAGPQRGERAQADARRVGASERAGHSAGPRRRHRPWATFT